MSDEDRLGWIVGVIVFLLAIALLIGAQMRF